MPRKQRNLDVFNLSFLDCICCGFGAIVLLFVLSKMGPPVPEMTKPDQTVLEESPEDLSGIVAELEEQLFEIRGETAIFNRDLVGKQEQVSENKQKIARLQGDLSDVLGEFAASKQMSAEANSEEGELAAARQRLSEEQRRLAQSSTPRPRPKADAPIGGIPVDSEYIIFVIDTSGSMQNFAWPLVQRKMSEVLDIYPRVKGIQVMNDMGEYMFTTYARKWIPDTPGRRKSVIKRLRTWKPFSNSSPVEGIRAAINTFYSPDKKISIYVFGDEFASGSPQAVIEEVDRVNKPTASGERRVRIHGIGFPTQFAGSGANFSGTRFSLLMRGLCERNGGSFVALNSLR